MNRRPLVAMGGKSVCAGASGDEVKVDRDTSDERGFATPKNNERNSRTLAELGLGELLSLVDALPELMTPANAALGVPYLAEPGEGGQGGEQINDQRCFWASPRGTVQ
jgi:hypothetical protein